MFTDFNEILKIAGKNGLSKQRMLQNVKRSRLLKRADNIRPYGANKEYSKKNKTFTRVKSSGGAEHRPYGANKEFSREQSKRSQSLKQADIIRPYGANKEY